jgi:hypothetical protein
MPQLALNTSSPMHLVYQGDNGVIVNMDLVNNILVGSDQGDLFASSPNTYVVGPLNFVAVDGSEDIWAIAASGTPAVQFMPGVTNWAPSPVQSANQIAVAGLATAANQVIQTTAINAGTTATGVVNTTLGTPAQDSIRTAIPQNIATTGVPLLTAAQVLQDGTGATLAASASQLIPSSGAYTANQVGFEFYCAAQYSTVNGANPFYLIIINWFDSTTGFLIDKEVFVGALGPIAGPQIPTRIKGPSRGDQVQVKLMNLDPAQTMKYNYALILNSRVLLAEQIDWTVDSSENTLTLPGHTLANPLLPDSRTLGCVSDTALAASGTDAWVFPPHSGYVYFNLWESGVANTNMLISLQPLPASIYGANTPWLINDVMASPANPDKLTYTFLAPNGPMQLNIKNSGSVAASYTGILTGQ